VGFINQVIQQKSDDLAESLPMQSIMETTPAVVKDRNQTEQVPDKPEP
jgi:hypothetical protein